MKPIAGASGRARLAAIAGAICVILAAIVAAPFLFTTQLAALALRNTFPLNNPTIKSATLDPSGLLVARGAVIHDTGKLARQPLIAIREVRIAFDWRELLSRRIRQVSIQGLAIYARTAGTSQLSLFELIPRRHRAPPPEIAVVDASGTLHSEPIPGFTRSQYEWPLSLHANAGKTPGSYLVMGSIGARRGTGFGALVEAQILRTSTGARLIVRRVAARKASLAIASATIRRFIGAAPEFGGPITAAFNTLSASGEVGVEARRVQVSGKVDFSGARAQLTGDPRIKLVLGQAAGAIEFAGSLPASAASRVSIRDLQIGKVESSIDAGLVRRYVRNLPAAIHGPIAGTLDALTVSGSGTAKNFAGPVRIENLCLQSLSVGNSTVAIQRMNGGGDFALRPGKAPLQALAIGGGRMEVASVTYGANAMSDVAAAFAMDNGVVSVDGFEARVFDGGISGRAASIDLVRRVSAPIDLRIKSIDIHKVLANISPSHIDADGRVSGAGELVAGEKGSISGHLDLAFDGPGILKVGEIPALEQRLEGNFGADLAQLAMKDLSHYPFKEGSFHLESQGTDTLLNLKFVREPRTGAEKTKPRKEIINGKEIWVGSLVVPKIDMSIPITGESLADILSIAAGLRQTAAGAGGVH